MLTADKEVAMVVMDKEDYIRNGEVNNKQVISDNRIPVKRDGDDKFRESDGCIRTRYDRILRKPDKL